MSEPVKKSPFRVLIEQASALGITKIHFEVDSKDYTENDVLRWTCVNMSEPSWKDAQDTYKEPFRGTNGQHSLTEMVAARRFEVEQRERNTK